MSSSDRVETEAPPKKKNRSIKYRIYSQEQAFRHLTQPRTEQQQQLYQITDDVLFHVWDAFCLSIDDDYREEYLPYLPHVFDLLLATDDGNDIYDYLVLIENTQPDSFKFDNLAKFRASKVVDLLLDYREKIFQSDNAVISE